MLKLFVSFLFFLISFSTILAQEGLINIDSSPEIQHLIEKKIEYNRTNSSSVSYHIQLFYGSENGAIRTQNEFISLFPNTSSTLEFDSPYWKVKVGNYKTRLKADKHLQKIILEFGDAIVIEPNK